MRRKKKVRFIHIETKEIREFVVKTIFDAWSSLANDEGKSPATLTDWLIQSVEEVYA
jgi:hypothetical protein